MTELEAKDFFGDMEPPKPMQDDKVNHPHYYTTGKVECIDGIEAAIAGLDAVEAFLTGCAIKYLWRWKHKGGVQDLEKCRWYVDRLIRKQAAAHA